MEHSINETMINELKELMEDDFPLLIETFLTDSDKRIISLENAIENKNATELREIAHGFKGSSSNLGADKLSEISFKLETMGRTDQLENMNEAYEQLCEEYKIVKQYFTSII